MPAGDLDLEQALRVALAAAREAGEITLRYFQRPDLKVERKADASPVTAADRAAEAAIRRRLREAFPEHGILGEEAGEEAGDAPWRWIVDPLDGTRSFARGVPLYAVLLALAPRDGEPVLGVAHFPALRETVWAVQGRGCFWNGRPARVSGERDPGRALILTTDPLRLLREEGEGILRVPSGALVRTWGDAYGHILVATGRAEVMVDPVMEVWDSAALLPIVVEAGGVFRDRSGRRTAYGGSAISCVPDLEGWVEATLLGPTSQTPTEAVPEGQRA